ncbi:hypothetical protein Tco_0032505 [Tanacetum coccineum]
MKHSYSNDDTCFSIDVIDEILEDFNALLDEGSKILQSIEGTLFEEEIFAEFNEFMAMTTDENSDSESDIEEPPFEKITIHTDYKIKTSLEEPPTDLELKPLPDNLEYVFLEEPCFLLVIISSQLSKEKKNKLVFVLKKHKEAFAWKTKDIPGGITFVTNENDELVPTRTVTVWRVCIDYRKLNEATAKDHFPLPFMDQIFNDLLRACPHHGFLELHQLDTFYNALNSNDQDSLNSAAGGNFLDKMPRDCLRIIESKSKVHNSRNKPVVAKVSLISSTPGISPDVAELKDMVKALLLDKKNQTQAPAPVKAVEESYVTYGGAHSYRNCPAIDGNVYRDNIQEYIS